MSAVTGAILVHAAGGLDHLQRGDFLL